MKTKRMTTKRIFNSFGRTVSNIFDYITMHWPRFVLTAITATFTWQAGYILTGQVYYAIMAVLLAEGLFLYWLSRIEMFENIYQQTISGIMFLASCIAIALTDISSAILIAHANDTQEFYKIVPGWVSLVVTNITPILASGNLVAYGLFEFMSDTSRDKREHASRRRHVERIVNASKRDITRLRARAKVLRSSRQLASIQKRHKRVFGEDLVEKVNDLMKFELMDKKKEAKKSIWARFVSDKNKINEDDVKQKRKYKRKK